MFRKVTSSLLNRHELQHQIELYRKLLRHEAWIGGTIFGPPQAGRRREFFCLDEHTWVWHEEWLDSQGQLRYVTTRYDLKLGGIIKSQNGVYLQVSREEAINLVKAARRYRQRVYDELYAPLFGKGQR